MNTERVNETYVERFDRYYDLFRTDSVQGLMRHRMKYVLKMMNLFEDKDALNSVIWKLQAPSIITRKDALTVVEAYAAKIESRSSEDERVKAINTMNVLDPLLSQTTFALKGKSGTVTLDWREYQIYQIILECEESLARELGVVSID